MSKVNPLNPVEVCAYFGGGDLTPPEVNRGLAWQTNEMTVLTCLSGQISGT